MVSVNCHMNNFIASVIYVLIYVDNQHSMDLSEMVYPSVKPLVLPDTDGQHPDVYVEHTVSL